MGGDYFFYSLRIKGTLREYNRKKKKNSMCYTEDLLIISNLRPAQICWLWNKNGLADPCPSLNRVYDTRV